MKVCKRFAWIFTLVISCPMVSGQYTGGSGRGEAREMLDSIVLSGGIIWRGGQALGAETDWNTAANWYPSAVIPGPNDTVVIEPNFNGYYPVLDQSRTIAALNFNGGDKKVVLGNHHLTIKHNIFRADPLNYVQTFNPAPAANQPASAPLTGTLLMEEKVDSACRLIYLQSGSHFEQNRPNRHVWSSCLGGGLYFRNHRVKS